MTTQPYIIDEKEKKKLAKAVLVFPLFGQSVLLGLKTKKVGAGFWNGPGGGIEHGETPEQAAIREAKEEFGITIEPESISRRGVMIFQNQQVNESFFTVEVQICVALKFNGTPKESETMVRPTLFKFSELPLRMMMPADRYWVPSVLIDHYTVLGSASYDANWNLLGKPAIQYVDRLPPFVPTPLA